MLHLYGNFVRPVFEQGTGLFLDQWSESTVSEQIPTIFTSGLRYGIYWVNISNNPQGQILHDNISHLFG